MENVSIEDVDGDGPFAGVRPNAGGGGTADDDWEVRSVIGESEVLRIDPTTDSVCEGDIVGGTGLRGGEGRRKVGGTTLREEDSCRTACDIVHTWGCLEGATDQRRYVDNGGMEEGLNIRRGRRRWRAHECRQPVRRSSRGNRDQAGIRRPRT